jgi:hypothetical protein
MRFAGCSGSGDVTSASLALEDAVAISVKKCRVLEVNGHWNGMACFLLLTFNCAMLALSIRGQRLFMISHVACADDMVDQ